VELEEEGGNFLFFSSSDACMEMRSNNSPFPPSGIETLEKEDKDEGYVPWAMGWIHTATNFVLSK